MNATRRREICADTPREMAIQRIGNRIAMGVLRRTLGEISSVSNSMSG